MKTTLSILILLTCVVLSFGQPDPVLRTKPNNHVDLIDKDPVQERKWSFSVFAGFSFIGTGVDIKNQMEESGFDDDRPGYQGVFDYVRSKAYPRNKTGVVWNLETRYQLSRKSAVNFTAGKINHSEVHGFDESYHDIWGSYGNYFRIKSDLWAASCNYVWRTGRHNDGFNLGPVVAKHIISADNPYSFQDNFSNSPSIKAGFNLGYVHSFVQNENWFLTFKANYTWLPDAEIGPFKSESRGYTSEFYDTHTRLSTLNIGIATGWRW